MLIKRVSKSGGSLVVPLPKNYLAAAGISRGDYVTVELDSQNRIILSRLESVLNRRKGNGKKD